MTRIQVEPLEHGNVSVSTTYLHSQRPQAPPWVLISHLYNLSPAPPKVQLSLANKDLPPSLICSAAGYYPLDVVVTWIREEQGGSPAQVSGASFSSIRQSMMGTYSISSTVTAEPGLAGATYICQVTHISLEEPLRVSMRVLPDTGIESVLSLPPLETPLLPGHLQPRADAHALAPFHPHTLDLPLPEWQPLSLQIPSLQVISLGWRGRCCSFPLGASSARREPLRPEHSPCEHQIVQ